MADIRITPESLRSKSSELKGLRGQHEEVMTRITSLVNGLSDQWSGEAQKAFQLNFNDMKPTFDKFVRILQGYAELMDKTAQEMQAADDEGARIIRQQTFN
jgi:WXG100 family type VII secretion target